ncbi:LysM peptidoglycan-binding domain-containing protein [Pseudoxanthomonas koreensis]|uniref:LysM peptidoglycan-binding domain-containing protein n=1 Tax=Pseudoxanthomonas koreensis TaxID=266061 RepID=UPI001391347B|nr:LysM peptidoglycan-binding domain-containing protein [Pseudoxanthomonas koreensis]KAF1697153.1 peptidoglycan-binding protein LysM [Pseudoxanthomonas koreensis]
MFKSLRTVAAVAMLTVATYAAAVESRGSHPETYVVVRGDTLWDIAGRFLGKPWLWPEIWQANPQVANPHLIFPGDVLSLAYLDRVAVQPGPRDEAPIGAVPLSEIEPFLKDVRVVDAFEHLPYVVGFEDNRLRGSAGQIAYVKGLDGIAAGQRYMVLRPTVRYALPRPFQHLEQNGSTMPLDGSLWSHYVPPSSRNEVLGYELAKVNIGTVVRAAGTGGAEVATLGLEDSGQEVRAGDRVIPVEAQAYDLQFFPHAPAIQPAEAPMVLAVGTVGGTAGGPRDVIAISAGRLDGIDNGTVFSLWRPGRHVNDRVHGPRTSRMDDQFTGGGSTVALPEEYAAHAMVFRTFDKVSYALVMDGVKPVRVGFGARHPDAQ